MSRYKGKISKLTNPRSGFISLASITRADGRPADLATAKDVFIHIDDNAALGSLQTDLEIIFEVITDVKRPDGLRARRAQPSASCPIEGGFEFHFDEPTIDHPMVPIRWCIKPETFARMEQEPTAGWILILVAQGMDDNNWRRHSFHHVSGASNIGMGRTFFTFPAPGQFTLVGYLLSSHPEKHLMEIDVKRAKRFFMERDAWDTQEAEVALDLDNIHTAATASATVSVPIGIFAKPLPQWMKAWLGYFGANRPHDECSMRGRIALACTLGVVAYLLWETLKRGYMLLVGLVHFVGGGNPLLAWRETFTSRLSACMFDGLFGRHDFEPMMKYEGWKAFCHPKLWLTIATLAIAYQLFPFMRSIIVTISTVGFAFIAIYFAIALYESLTKNGATEKRAEREKAQAAQAAEEAARHLALIREYAVCGIEPTNQPKSFKLVWTGIKRKVCRTYA